MVILVNIIFQNNKNSYVIKNDFIRLKDVLHVYWNDKMLFWQQCILLRKKYFNSGHHIIQVYFYHNDKIFIILH